jgi:hypothetical protein
MYNQGYGNYNPADYAALQAQQQVNYQGYSGATSGTMVAGTQQTFNPNTQGIQQVQKYNSQEEPGGTGPIKNCKFSNYLNCSVANKKQGIEARQFAPY